MTDKSRDPHMTAIENVYAAIKDLDDSGRKKVLLSMFAFLNFEAPSFSSMPAFKPAAGEGKQTGTFASRPVSLVELIKDKNAGTSAQRIALFAYYREKSEGQARFGRDDLRNYFAMAKQPPAANYDRDFVEAVRKGWIHEDGTDSYLTTKGIEAVESNFEGERKFVKGHKAGPKRKRSSHKTPAKLSRKRKP